MNVWLKENGDLLRGDMLVRWVLRSDLVPIPRTVEITVRMIDGIEKQIKEGESIWTGAEKLRYRILKTEKHDPAGYIQGSAPVQLITATAVLEPLHRVTFIRGQAIIRQNAQFSAIYRACGASVAFGDDLRVERFNCFTGQVPTFHIAQALQEECAAVVFRSGKLHFIRLPDLMKQKSKAEITQSDTAALKKSGFIERNAIPAYYSMDAAGKVIHGDLPADTRNAQFIPRTSERILRNLSRVLVTRRVVRSSLSEHLNAGDVIKVAGASQAIITAAHVFENIDGRTDSYSKLWVGDMNK